MRLFFDFKAIRTAAIYILTISLLSPAFAQQYTADDTDGYYNEDFIRYDNYIYNSNIKTVQVYRGGWETSYPIINLNANERLRLSFDDLSGEIGNYGYTYIHCNANWEPSDLDQFDYIDGMQDDIITDVSYSKDTKQKYIHYDLTFPNENINLLKSGNYLLKIFDMDNDNRPAITWRFYIADQLVSVIPDIKRSTVAQHTFYKHEIDFKIIQSSYNITNPYSDLKVVILQNQRWDNAITSLKPTFVRGNELIYDYDEDNTFDAGSEFRFFDIRDVYYRALRTSKIVQENDTFNAYINTDKARGILSYEDAPDINGRFYIKDDDPRNDRILDGEYVKVHLKLPYPNPIEDGDLYVFGELSQWKNNKDFKLRYNETKRRYETTLFVKQGYYNYMYLYFKDGERQGNLGLIEGNHSETSNEYTFLIYHRQNGDIHDQLIGVRTETFPQR